SNDGRSVTGSGLAVRAVARAAPTCARPLLGHFLAPACPSATQQSGAVPDQRMPRKNARMASTNNSGSSRAAKWPPDGIRVQCTRLYEASTHVRGGRNSSLGNRATPVGTSTRPSAIPESRLRLVSQYMRVEALIVPVTQ